MSQFLSLGAAVIAFVGLHLVLSSRPVRGPLVTRLGPAGFAGGYSAVIGVVFVWMVWAWAVAPYERLWIAPGWTRWIPFLGMPVAILFLVLGFSTPSPTAVGQEKRLGEPEAVRGVLRVTRHPANWGFALWALAHLPPNGDVRSVLLMGGIVVLALAGMVHIDARRARDHGDAWRAFAGRTSLVPFAAILAGRQHLSLREIGATRPLIALAVYGVLLLVHDWLIGVPPWPW